MADADYSKPFSSSDASKIGLRGVLYLWQDGKNSVIAYASRSLKPIEDREILSCLSCSKMRRDNAFTTTCSVWYSRL